MIDDLGKLSKHLDDVARKCDLDSAAAPPTGEGTRVESASPERDWLNKNRHKFLTGELVYPYGHSKEKIEYLDEVAMLRAYAAAAPVATKGGWPCQSCGYGHEAETPCPPKQITAPVAGTTVEEVAAAIAKEWNEKTPNGGGLPHSVTAVEQAALAILRPYFTSQPPSDEAIRLRSALQNFVDSAVTDADMCAICGNDPNQCSPGCAVEIAKAALAAPVTPQQIYGQAKLRWEKSI